MRLMLEKIKSNTMIQQSNSRDARYKRVRQRVSLIPIVTDEVSNIDDNRSDGQVYQVDSIPRLKLPSNGAHHRSGLLHFEVVQKAFLPPYFTDDSVAFYDLPTSTIPIIQNASDAIAVQGEEKGGGYAANIRKLLKSSGIYALASLASPLVSLVLAPFLTRNLSHNQYGMLAVMNTAIALLAGITQLGLSSAFFRSYNYDYEAQNDRLRVLSTLVALLLFTSMAATLAIMIAAPPIADVLFKSASFSDLIKVGITIVLLQNLTIPGFAWLRAEGRATIFATLSITNLLVNGGATILLVGVFHMGVAGSLWGTGCGYAVVIVCTLPLIITRAGMRPRPDIAKGLLSFGLPNVTTIISIWVLQLSDRYLLSTLGSLSQTASYAVAYSLGSVLSVVVLSPFTLAWPSAMFTIAKRKDALRVFQLVFRWYSIILLFAAFALSLVSTIVLDLFFPPAYHPAAPIIPIIALSTMFFGIYNLFTTGISIKRKTWYAFALMSIAALVNVGLNLVLIPLYGSIGAALATLFAYMLLVIIAYVVNQRLYPIPFELRMFIPALLIGVVFYVGSALLSQKLGMYIGWLVFLIILVIYGGCLKLIGDFQTRRSKNVFKQTREVFLS